MGMDADQVNRSVDGDCAVTGWTFGLQMLTFRTI
jgi:hypothetical protein